jgi:hypothetical protein
VRVGAALAPDRPDALVAQLLGDAVADGAELALRAAGADDEVVRHRSQLRDVEQDDVGGLLVLGGVHDLAGDLERGEAGAAFAERLLDLGFGRRIRFGGGRRFDLGLEGVGERGLGRGRLARRRGSPSGLGIDSGGSAGGAPAAASGAPAGGAPAGGRFGDESVTSGGPHWVGRTIQPMVADVRLHGRRHEIADRWPAAAGPHVGRGMGQRHGSTHSTPGAESEPPGSMAASLAASGSGAPGRGTTASRASSRMRSGSCQVRRSRPAPRPR